MTNTWYSSHTVSQTRLFLLAIALPVPFFFFPQSIHAVLSVGLVESSVSLRTCSASVLLGFLCLFKRERERDAINLFLASAL